METGDIPGPVGPAEYSGGRRAVKIVGAGRRIAIEAVGWIGVSSAARFAGVRCRPMRRTTRFLASLFMLSPLLAVPVMAVYGVPQLTPLVRWPRAASTDERSAPTTARPVAGGAGFAVPASSDLGRSSAASRRHPLPATTRVLAERSVPPSAPQPQPQPSWREAIGRLQATGVRGYRLRTGSRLGEFFFSCSVPSTEHPRLVRRFEAEADEPLRALELVLGQIAEWQSSHVASRSGSNRP